jgi:hypothetical protein
MICHAATFDQPPKNSTENNAIRPCHRFSLVQTCNAQTALYNMTSTEKAKLQSAALELARLTAGLLMMGTLVVILPFLFAVL